MTLSGKWVFNSINLLIVQFACLTILAALTIGSTELQANPIRDVEFRWPRGEIPFCVIFEMANLPGRIALKPNLHLQMENLPKAIEQTWPNSLQTDDDNFLKKRDLLIPMLNKLFERMKLWQNYTPIRFKADHCDESRYTVLRITLKASTADRLTSSATVGYLPPIGSQRYILILSTNSLDHEFGHVVGMDHTFLRYDHPQNIVIFRNFLSESMASHFTRKLYMKQDIGFYDIYSVMHYRSFYNGIEQPAVLAIRKPDLDKEQAYYYCKDAQKPEHGTPCLPKSTFIPRRVPVTYNDLWLVNAMYCLPEYCKNVNANRCASPEICTPAIKRSKRARQHANTRPFPYQNIIRQALTTMAHENNQIW